MTSGGYGYTVARSIAYAYLPAGTPAGARVDVQVDGTWVPAHGGREPAVRPEG